VGDDASHAIPTGTTTTPPAAPLAVTAPAPQVAAAGDSDPPVTFAQRARAYGVHLLTASGVVFAFLAAAEVCAPAPDPRLVFLYLAVQVLIDAADGPMARLWQVKLRAPQISGRTIDDLVDYLTYTFVPLLLVWRMGWVPDPAGLWVAPAMVASLFGFANTAAKDEGGGFFLGFPSYWNIVAIYLGLMKGAVGPWPGAVLVVALTVLTVLPVRFVYPNLAPRPWRAPTLIGAVVWLALLVVILADYHSPPAWLVWLSLTYPVFYVGLSVWLDVRSRPSRAGPAERAHQP
jgi:phosphatidylcholine synthase